MPRHGNKSLQALAQNDIGEEKVRTNQNKMYMGFNLAKKV